MLVAEIPMVDLTQPPFFFYHKESPLSNHYPSPFTINGVAFFHMEGFLMFCKAMLFNDRNIAQKILEAYSPQAAKNLGRQVENFDKAVWDLRSPSYALKGNIAKHQQNIVCYRTLMETGLRELVEASRTDRIWGIGMSATDPNILRRELWGENRHGNSLMQTRHYFAQGGL